VRRLLIIAVALAVCVAGLQAADKSDDTPKAAKTRMLLKKKVSVEYKDTRLNDIVDDLKDQVKGLHVRLDNKGGVSNNMTLTYKADDKPLDEVLDQMFKKYDLGYYVISQKNNAYDGTVLIVKGKARGYPEEKK
jgi:type II secretory pathway component GspD/PulD (secretin)